MKHALLLLALALIATEATPQLPPQNDKATVEGTVKRSDTGEPLSGVRITLLQSAISTTTGKDGHFLFKDIPVHSRNTIEAQRDGFFPPVNGGRPVSRYAPPPSNLNIVPPPASPAQKHVTVDAARNYVVDFDLLPGGNVSGRILDPDRQPIPRVKVNVLRRVFQNGQDTLQSRGTTQTDDLGEFRIFWIEPGDYFLTAEYPTQGAASPGPRDTLVRTFYPGVSEENRAVVITVAPGAELVSNFDLVSNAKVRVTGKVVNSISNAVPNSYYLIPRDSRIQTGKPSPIPNVSPNRRKGEFEFTAVQPGSYYLFPIVAGQGYTLTGRTPIDVGYKDAEGITAVIKPNVDLNGLMVMDSTSPKVRLVLPNEELTLIARDTVPTLQSASLRSRVQDASGVFKFAALPEGTYQLATVGSPALAFGGWYISEIRQGARSALEDGLVIVGPNDAEPLRVTLKDNGAKIEGVVRDSQSKPIPMATVSLIPRSGLRRNPLLYQRAVSDANGRFTLRGIGPGDYKLFAWEGLPTGADENPDVIAVYEGRGQVINVIPGLSLKVTVDLIPTEKK